MHKADIATQIQQQAGISETEAARLLDWILSLLKTTLQKGEPVVIAGLGKFTVRVKAPRTGHNFKTGEALIITARRVVSFHPIKMEVISVQGPER